MHIVRVVFLVTDSETPDRPLPLTRLRARLARPRGYKRVDALLSADQPKAAVAALSVPELHQLITEVGFADTYELISLATPNQIRGCVDIDVWDRDRVQLDAVKPWLAAVLDAGFEHLRTIWDGLDSEFRSLVIQRWTRIYDLSLGEDPDDDPEDERPVYMTPDQFFAVRLTAPDEETRVLTQRIIDDLYRADMVLARHTLMAARSELPSQLEEMSYRWRSGRMADMGYVDFHEALEVYRPIDAASVSIGENSQDRFPAADDEAPHSLPVPMAETVVGRTFLALAMDRAGVGAEAQRLETALVILVNKVLAAAKVNPGDTEAVGVGAEHATATLALGLDTIAGGDLDRAAEALRTISLTRLHRVGYSATLPLARVARQVAPRALAAGDPVPQLLEALLSPRPFFPRELDDPPGEGPRPFESGHDLRRAAEALTVLALRVAVADALGVDTLALSQQPEPRPGLDDFARTALARSLAGGGLEAGPLRPEELEQLRAAAPFSNERQAAAVEQLRAQVVGAGVTSGEVLLSRLAHSWVLEIEEQFAAIPRGAEIDPRFIGGIIVQTGLE